MYDDYNLFCAHALQGWIIALGQRHQEHGYTDTNACYEAVRLATQTATEMCECLKFKKKNNDINIDSLTNTIKEDIKTVMVDINKKLSGKGESNV